MFTSQKTNPAPDIAPVNAGTSYMSYREETHFHVHISAHLVSYKHRTAQVGRDFKDQLVPTFLPWVGMPLTRTACQGLTNLVLNTSGDWASKMSLGNLFMES